MMTKTEDDIYYGEDDIYFDSTDDDDGDEGKKCGGFLWRERRWGSATVEQPW
jgi:hypothetical protein